MQKPAIKVLLIEDNPAEADLIKEMLAKAPKQEFSVQHAEYLADALGWLQSQEFDVALVDLGLPDSQGLDTALAVRKQTKRTPVVVLTVLDDKDTALKALEMDVQDYLVKDEITGNLLLRAIRYAIQRKRDVESLRESEQRFASFMLHLPAAAWIKDMRGRYVHANAEAERIFSTPLPELRGKTDEDIFPPETARQFRENDERALAEGRHLRTTEDLRQADGIEHHFIVSKFAVPGPEDRPAYVAGVALDITERKRAEEALRRVQEQLQMITSLMAAGVNYCNRERRYVWVSPTYAGMLGRRPEEIAGRPIKEIIGTEAYENISPFIERVLAGQKVEYETRVHYRGGELRWVTVVYTPTYDTKGIPDGWIAVVTDITAMKELELVLQQAKEHLEETVAERTTELNLNIILLREEIAERIRVEQALKEETEQRLRTLQELREKEQLLIQQSRMAAMGEMIGFIAHQWRQPLNTLGLIVQGLSIRYKRGDFSQEHLDKSTTEAMRVITEMSRTIDDFRNFFKTEREKVQFRLNDVLAKTIKLVEASFREGNITIEVSAQDDVVAEGYPNEYSQVLLNILLNARDACLERTVEQPGISIRVFTEKDRAVMTIADNAGGIPEQIMDRIFDPYFTTKGPDRGTGIGLYMAKTIIERNMHGVLSVRNTADGAEFRIEV